MLTPRPPTTAHTQHTTTNRRESTQAQCGARLAHDAARQPGRRQRPSPDSAAKRRRMAMQNRGPTCGDLGAQPLSLLAQLPQRD